MELNLAADKELDNELDKGMEKEINNKKTF